MLDFINTVQDEHMWQDAILWEKALMLPFLLLVLVALIPLAIVSIPIWFSQRRRPQIFGP